MAKKNDTDRPSKNREKLLWGCVCLGLSVWMFCLGILVGRGTAPVHFDMEALQKELAVLKKAEVEKKRREYPKDKTDLAFYEALKRSPDTDPPVAKTPASQKPVANKEAPDRGKPNTAIPRKTRDDRFKKPPKSARVVPPPPTVGWTLQVAAFKTAADAEQMVTKLKQKGYEAYSLDEQIPGKGLWHRVRVGHYPSMQEARSMAAQLHRKGYSPLLINTEGH